MALPKYLFSETLDEPLNGLDNNAAAPLAKDRFEGEVEGTELAREAIPLSPASNEQLSHGVLTLSRGECPPLTIGERAYV